MKAVRRTRVPLSLVELLTFSTSLIIVFNVFWWGGVGGVCALRLLN